MSAALQLPGAARPLAEFASLLRAFGFAIAPEQVVTFMAAVTLLGPRSFADIRQAAHAALAPPPERHREFEQLLAAFFAGTLKRAPPAPEVDGRSERRRAPGRGLDLPPVTASADCGLSATAAERLARRGFGRTEPDPALSRLVRRAPPLLPRQRAFRRTAAKSGKALDLRKTLRRAIMSDAEVMQLIMSRRRTRQRRVLVLIDISGSMKAHTQNYLHFAHAITGAADKVEIFTFGTRLTRITRAMQLRNCDRALQAAEQRVEDWDGGTRIGDALSRFLAVPRFAGYARGAFCVVLSDGLERGDPADMIAAVRQLSRRAWRLAWLTPLAADHRFRPQTAALRAILPFLDDFGEGGSLESLCSYVLSASAGDERWNIGKWRELAS